MFATPRTFDPMQDEHPVQWLLSKMDINLYSVVHQWLTEIVETDPAPKPSDYTFPDWCCQNVVCSPLVQQLSKMTPLFQDQNRIPFPAPCLAFSMKMPPDGLPVFDDWLLHASSIWAVGFEPWRESIEVKPLREDLVGNDLDFGVLEPTKGLGRVSMLLFTVFYSYLKLKDILVDGSPEKTEFRQYLGQNQTIHQKIDFSQWGYLGHSCIAFELSMCSNSQG